MAKVTTESLKYQTEHFLLLLDQYLNKKNYLVTFANITLKNVYKY